MRTHAHMHTQETSEQESGGCMLVVYRVWVMVAVYIHTSRRRLSNVADYAHQFVGLQETESFIQTILVHVYANTTATIVQ